MISLVWYKATNVKTPVEIEFIAVVMILRLAG